MEDCWSKLFSKILHQKWNSSTNKVYTCSSSILEEHNSSPI